MIAFTGPIVPHADIQKRYDRTILLNVGEEEGSTRENVDLSIREDGK